MEAPAAREMTQQKRPPPVATRWKPGRSANPGGRPKGVRALVSRRTHAGKDILLFWHNVMCGMIPCRTADRVKASELLAERLWGKPVATEVQLRLDAEQGAALDLPDAVLETLARALLARVGARSDTIDAPSADKPPEPPALPAADSLIDSQAVSPRPADSCEKSELRSVPTDHPTPGGEPGQGPPSSDARGDPT